MRKYVGILLSSNKPSELIWASTTPITIQGKPSELDPVNNKTIVDRNAIAARVMKSGGIAVNDLYDLLKDHLSDMRGDRFHWKGQGYALMAKQVAREIEEALG